MTRPFLLLENASLKEHPINLPLRDGPSGAEALTASGGEGASIATSGRFPPYCSLGKNFRTGQISNLGLNLSWH